MKFGTETAGIIITQYVQLYSIQVYFRQKFIENYYCQTSRGTIRYDRE